MLDLCYLLPDHQVWLFSGYDNITVEAGRGGRYREQDWLTHEHLRKMQFLSSMIRAITAQENSKKRQLRTEYS
jgi:hypothetical protein